MAWPCPRSVSASASSVAWVRSSERPLQADRQAVAVDGFVGVGEGGFEFGCVFGVRSDVRAGRLGSQPVQQVGERDAVDRGDAAELVERQRPQGCGALVLDVCDRVVRQARALSDVAGRQAPPSR